MVQVTKKISKAFSVILVIAMLCTMFSGAAFAEQYNSADYVTMDAEQTQSLAGIYEYSLEMGTDMSLMLYLNIDETGNFVFSRSADFSSNEKGAGVVLAGVNGDYAMVYSVVNGETVEEDANVATFVVEEDGSLQFTSKLWFGSTTPSLTAEDGTETFLKFVVSSAEVIDEPELIGGAYAVDTSWSAMAGTYAPVLTADVEAMTFELGDANNTEAVPVTGIIEYLGNGSYQLVCEDGRTIDFVYANELITITAVVNAAPIEEEADSELAGEYHVDLSGSFMTTFEDLVIAIDSEAMIFSVYEANDAQNVLETGALVETEGVYALVYEGVEPVEGIGTSMVWEEDAITLTSVFTAAIPEEVAEGIDEGIKFGTYGGKYTYQPGGMPMAIEYYYSMNLKEDGTYTFESYYVVSGDEYEGISESGTYAAQNGVLTLTTSSGKVINGTIDTNGNATLNRSLGSGMSGGEGTKFDIELTYGSVPAPGDSTEIAYGTYGGDYSVAAMGGSIDYAVTLTLNKDGSYTYKVSFVVGGQNYTETETGSYTVDGESLRLTSSAGKVMVGKVRSDGTASVTRLVSSFASSAATVDLKLGYTPTAGGTANPDSGEDEGDDDINDDTTDDNNDDVNTDVGCKLGVYSGEYSYQPNGMPMSLDYSYSLDLNDDGTYTFESTYNVAGNDYAGLNETGTYTVAEGVLTLTATDGSVWTGTIDADGNATLNRPLGTAMSGSGYGSSFDITLTYGDGETEETPDEGTLESGAYNVDISWSPMGGMFSPVLDIDAENMTFNVYNATAPETSKGAGSISYADGVYTMTYENGNTTTFTYADDVITFTSKLWYGSASFNSAGDDGVFVPYTATKAAAGDGETDETPDEGTLESGAYNVDISWSPMGGMFSPVLDIDAENMTFNVYNATAPETSKGAGSISYADGVYTMTYENGNTTTFTYADGVITFTSKLWYGSASFNSAGDDGVFVPYTAQVGSSGTEEETPEYKTGIYSGEYAYQPGGMPMTIDYVYSMTLNEDDSYSFKSSYYVSGTEYAGLDETGTYTVEEGVLTLTAADSSVWTGTIDADGNATLTRPLGASMSGSGYGSSFDITLTYGETTGDDDTAGGDDTTGDDTTGDDEAETYLASGECGDAATWTLSEDYVLTISGTGATYDYSYGKQPWASYLSSITDLVVEDGITYVGNYVMFMGTSLTGISMSNSVEAIGQRTFYGCTKLSSVSLPAGMTTLGEYAFRDCTGLKSIDLGGVQKISGDCFYGCTSLETVTGTDNVTSISSYAFYNCALTSFTIPANVTAISPSTFYGCASLTSIDLNNVQTIGTNAFNGCTSLTAVTIPASVNSIAANAFNGCTGLTSIVFEGAPSISSNSFTGVTATCSYHGINEAWTEETLTNYGGTLTWVNLDEEETPAYKTGTYGGEYAYQPGGMPMTIDYVYSMTLNEDGSYSFKSSYYVSGTEYAGLDETGTYTVAEGVLTLTATDGSVWTGSIDADGNATLNRPLGASMSGSGYGSSFDITLTYGSVGSADSGDEATETTESTEETTEETEETTESTEETTESTEETTESTEETTESTEETTESTEETTETTEETTESTEETTESTEDTEIAEVTSADEE